MKKMKVAGIVGYPLGHSVSPAMHNAAFRYAKIHALYLPFEVNDFGFEAAMEGFRTMRVMGLNVTVPFKEAAAGYLDRLDPFAEKVGAVNTVVPKGGRWVGYNTDGEGFWRSLPSAWQKAIRGGVLILGAGGTARALAGRLADEGVTPMYLANRTPHRAGKLARMMGGWRRRINFEIISWNTSFIREILPKVNVILNATSSGLNYGDRLPLPGGILPEGLKVYDVIYHTQDTPLLNWASSHRLPALTGREMLVQQGALAWSLWTGRPAPLAVMRRAVKRALD